MSTFSRVCSALCGPLVLLAWLPGCDPASLSVKEIQEHPEYFNGQRVRVRGWTRFNYVVAGVGCPRQNPCCNSGQGILALSPEPVSAQTVSLPGVGIPDFSCIKDGCNAVCGPVDPTALAFELVGIVKQVPGPIPLYLSSVALYDIDWPESSQLTGGGDLFGMQKRPLGMGTFIVPDVNY